MVFAGIPIGVAYAQEPAITVAITTALGSAPRLFARETAIGIINAVVAVFDIKFVKIQQRINTTNVSMYGDGFSPSVPITLLAISSPAPVSCKAAARESQDSVGPEDPPCGAIRYQRGQKLLTPTSYISHQ